MGPLWSSESAFVFGSPFGLPFLSGWVPVNASLSDPAFPSLDTTCRNVARRMDDGWRANEEETGPSVPSNRHWIGGIAPASVSPRAKQDPTRSEPTNRRSRPRGSKACHSLATHPEAPGGAGRRKKRRDSTRKMSAPVWNRSRAGLPKPHHLVSGTRGGGGKLGALRQFFLHSSIR